MSTITISHDYSNSLTHVEVVGELDHHDVLPVLRDCYEEKSSSLFIWDFSKGNLKEITADDLRKLAHIAQEFGPNQITGKTALVMEKRANFGVGRMFEVYAESQGLPYEIRTFYTEEKALEWLDLKNAVLHFDRRKKVESN